MRLLFALGPVQVFVDQSRRTRDFWASSWLLSWLSGQAMLAGLRSSAKARMESPAFDATAIIELIARSHAALPNRFDLTTDDASAAGRSAASAAQQAWKSLTDAVWSEFVEAVADQGNGTRAIWERQVSSFWEIAWVVSDDGSEIMRRKFWRTPSITIEPGDHCALMPQWQELSGHVASSGSQARARQREFWEQVRKRSGSSTLDFDAREQFCAVALTKRLFPRLPASLRQRLFGAPVDQSFWPSTTDLAAEPWRKNITARFPERAIQYANEVAEATGHPNTFANLHGNYLIETALANDAGTPVITGLRQNLIEALRALCVHVGSAPSSYYAILRADGDKIGEQARDAREAGRMETFTRSLTTFTERIPRVVQNSGGHCVYAGGDDVLALCNVEDAIRCAGSIEQAFAEAFARYETPPTISVAVLFVHFRLALREAFAASHRLLDDVAKHKAGRASLALAVHKGSAPAAEFAAPWSWWREIRDGRPRLELLPTLIDAPRNGDAGHAAITRHYVYKVDAMLQSLRSEHEQRRLPGTFLTLDHALNRELPALLTSELLVGRSPPSNLDNLNAVREEARARVDLFVDFCRQVDGRGPRPGTFSLDGPRLAIFLSGEDRT